jgi:hypothetical protein
MLPREDWMWVAVVTYVAAQFGLGMALFIGHVIPMLVQ